MSPSSPRKQSSATTSKLRRSTRLAKRIKSDMQEQSTISQDGRPSLPQKRGRSPYKKESRQQSGSKKRGRPPCEKKSGQQSGLNKRQKPQKKQASREQSVSSDEGQSTSIQDNGQSTSIQGNGQSTSIQDNGQSTSIQYNGQSTSIQYNGQSTSIQNNVFPDDGQSTPMEIVLSSDEEQSTTMEIIPREQIRVMRMDEVDEEKELDDFSTPILQILEEYFPDLEIDEEAMNGMNICINHIFQNLAKRAVSFTTDKSITVGSIELAIKHIMKGPIKNYCMSEGRKAIEKFELLE